MTVETRTNLNGPYDLDGTLVFPRKFKVVDPDHLRVIHQIGTDETVITQGFTQTGIGDDEGTIEFTTATIPTGGRIWIIRAVPNIQSTDYYSQASVEPEQVEEDLDLLTMQMQDMAEEVARSLKVPVGDESDGGKLASGILRLYESADEIDTVAGVAPHVVTVAGVSAEVKTVADNMSAIIQAEGSALNLVPQSYVAASGQTDFTLPVPAMSSPNVFVWVGGVRQVPDDDYSVLDDTLTLAEGAAGGVSVDVLIVTAVSMSDVRAEASAAKDARDKSRDWAESPTPPDGPGTKSSKTWAGDAAGHAAAIGDAINAVYTLPEDRLSLPATNGAPLDDDLTPGAQTFTDEIRENYAAPPNGVVNAAARATGLIMFDPPSQESTNYVYTDVPWFTHRGSTFRALPVDISATVFNSLVGPCLFEPVATNSWGMLVWRYIGDKPIHSFLQGQMAMKVRASGAANDAFQKLVLNLRTWNAPHMEAGGQSSGKRFLSSFIGSYQQPVKMSDYEGMNDECLPLTQAVWDLHNADPDRFVGYDNGYFTSSSGEVLLTTEGGNPIGPEVRTTKWIDVSDIDASERCLAVWVEGTIARRSRMQWKDSNGDVHYYPAMSRDQHCRRVFRLPHGAQEVRFYYSGVGDNVSSIAVKRMGLQNSAEHDPLKGLWYDAQFPFGRDVTLWPGAEYAFDLITLVYNDASGREWAFRDYGSGFSMPFDATDFLRETASRYFGS